MKAYRWAMLFSVLLVAPILAQVPGEADPDTLRRLGALLPSDSRFKDAMNLLKNGQSIDPQMLQQMQKMMQSDPTYFKNLAKSLQSNPEQMKQFIEQAKQTPPQFPPPQVQPPRPPMPPGVEPPQPPMPPGIEPKPFEPPPQFRQPPDRPPQRFPDRSQQQPDMTQNKEYQAMTQFWEQNVGPLEKTPEVQQAIQEMVMNGGIDGADGKSTSFLKDLFKDGGNTGSPSNASSLMKWFGKQTSGSNWKMPSWGGPRPNAPNLSAPRAPSGFNAPNMSGGTGLTIAGLGTFGTILFFGILTAVVVYLGMKYWPEITGRPERLQPLAGLGPWPIDPRTIADREGLVKAFEYVSQLECGPPAVVWNHMTIAYGLRLHVPESDGYADALARLYAVARYAPSNEPMTSNDISEARGFLCQLAGVRSV